jgi:hypothetical protein
MTLRAMGLVCIGFPGIIIIGNGARNDRIATEERRFVMIVIKLRVDKRVRDTVWVTVFAGEGEAIDSSTTVRQAATMQPAGKLVLREQEWCAFAHALLCGADLSGRQLRCEIDNLHPWYTERPDCATCTKRNRLKNEQPCNSCFGAIPTENHYEEGDA